MYSSIPTTGTLVQGQKVDRVPVAGQSMGYACGTSGTFGSLASGATATGASGSKLVVVSDLTGLLPGMFISITGGVTRAEIIEMESDGTVRLGTALSADVTGAAVSLAAPVVVSMPNFS